MFSTSFAFLPACRTTKGGSSGDSVLWDTPENRSVTVNFIKEAVAELLPGVNQNDPAVEQFAEALQKNETKQTESAQFLLKKVAEQRKSGAPLDIESSEVSNYIVEQFLAMTNYIAVHQQKESVLKYIGYEGMMTTSAAN